MKLGMNSESYFLKKETCISQRWKPFSVLSMAPYSPSKPPMSWAPKLPDFASLPPSMISTTTPNLFPALSLPYNPNWTCFQWTASKQQAVVDCTKVSWVWKQNKLRQHLLTSCIPTPTFWTDKQSGSRSPMMVQKAVGKQRDETHHAKANLKTDMVGWWAI